MFRIIIACHEIPALTHSFDNRIEFIQVNIPFPENLYEQMVDKGYKVHVIAKRICEYGGGYSLIADADDLYSNRIAEFVFSNPGQHGWVMKKGYEYIWGKDWLKLSLKHPPQPIVNFTPADLPADMNDALAPSNIDRQYIIRKGHGNIEKVCKELGRELKPFPFIGHVYVKYHGDNHSILNGQDSLFRRISRVFMPTIYPNKHLQIKNEFSIDWL